MDKTIVQMRQDLARAEYSEWTQRRYSAYAQKFVQHVEKPVAEISRGELRSFVDAVMAEEKSPWHKGRVLSALLYLYRKTLEGIRGKRREDTGSPNTHAGGSQL